DQDGHLDEGWKRKPRRRRRAWRGDRGGVAASVAEDALACGVRGKTEHVYPPPSDARSPWCGRGRDAAHERRLPFVPLWRRYVNSRSLTCGTKRASTRTSGITIPISPSSIARQPAAYRRVRS